MQDRMSNPMPKRICPGVGGWDLGFNYAIVRPYAPKPSEVSLNTLGHETAQGYINQNRAIKLRWSGGIDSTFALTFLLENLQHADQLTVVHSAESVAENPRYLEHIKKFGVSTQLLEDTWWVLNDPDVMTIDGGGGGVIAGSMSTVFYNNWHTRLSAPWQEYINDIDVIAGLSNKLPGDVTTVYDLYFWFKMGIMLQWFYLESIMCNLEYPESASSFFDSQAWINWAETNRHWAVNETATNPKIPFKQEIYRYWPDRDYLDNKGKVASYMGNTWSARKIALHRQQFLFMYLDAQSRIRTYRPAAWPLLDFDVIAADMVGL